MELFDEIDDVGLLDALVVLLQTGDALLATSELVPFENDDVFGLDENRFPLLGNDAGLVAVSDAIKDDNW